MSNDAPTICSLDEVEVYMEEEERDYLTTQLKGMYEHDDKLQAMKRAPSITTCRVNQILATREEIVEGLQAEVPAWQNRSRYKCIMKTRPWYSLHCIQC